MADRPLQDSVIAYIEERYGACPVPAGRGMSVFLHEGNGRRFAVLNGDSLSVRARDIYALDELLHHDGISPGGQRGKWVSISLDGTVPYDEIIALVDMSHDAAGGRRKEGASTWAMPGYP